MDAERFTDIFSRLHAGMRRLALRIVGDEEEASDAVQDAFCSLWRRKDEIDDDGRIEGLMAVSVRNRCLTQMRTHSRYRMDRIVDPVESGLSDGAVSADTSGGGGMSVFSGGGEFPIDDTCEDETVAIYREVEALMRKHLSERDREILIMREQYEADFDEIAERFDMTPAAVRMALSRARKGVLKAYKERNRDGKEIIGD